MKITFLGTSHGIPEVDRVLSGAMIEVGDNIYLVDAGAPITEKMISMGVDFERIKAIFITHPHSDHALGLIHLVNLGSWAARYKCMNMDILLPEIGMKDSLVAALGMFHQKIREDGFRFSEITEGEIWNDGVLKVTAIPTKHCPPYPSFAFLLEAEGKRVAFSGDISHHMRGDDMPRCAMEEPRLDAFILELAHNEIDHLRPYLERVTAKALYFNHISPSKLPGVVAEADSFGYPITFLNDGDVITL